MVTPVTKPWADTGVRRVRRVLARLRKRREACIVVGNRRRVQRGRGWC
jgi:hypothetical protein